MKYEVKYSNKYNNLFKEKVGSIIDFYYNNKKTTAKIINFNEKENTVLFEITDKDLIMYMNEVKYFDKSVGYCK